jgi:tetratricopeptide (TPR) repeat protein
MSLAYGFSRWRARAYAKGELKRHKASPAVLSTLIERAKACVYSQPARASGLLLAICEAARMRADYQSLARALSLSAQIAKGNGKLPDAIVLASEARLAAQHIGDWVGQLSADFSLATVYREIGDHNRAEMILHQLIATARLHNDLLREADYMFELGMLRLDQTRHREATSLFAVAHHTYQESSDPNALLALNMRAYAHIQLGELDSAYETAQHALDVATQTEHPERSSFLHTFAHVCLLRGDLSAAESLLAEAHTTGSQCSAWINLHLDITSALLRRELGHSEEAIASLIEIASKAERSAFGTIERDARAALEATYVKAGRTAEAEACKRALRRLADRQAQIKAQQQRDTRSVQHRVSELVVQWNSMPTA